jgi:hypothetical protein
VLARRLSPSAFLGGLALLSARVRLEPAIVAG